MKKLTTLCLLGLFVAACGSEGDGTDDLDERRDSQEDRFVADGKADSNGIEDRSWKAQCVLNVANRATLAELDDDMSLWSVAAKNIVAGRPYDTLEALDDVSWVGWYAFNQMSSYARDHGHCPALGEEYIPAGEAEDTVAVAEAGMAHIQGKFDEGQRPALRDAHPKAHGCVKAFFEVDNARLPASMRVGVFAEQGHEFPAWIRFSNGSFTISPDPEGDIRGMAIKLMDVPGEKILERARDAKTQDFLLINTPVLMVRNAHDYVEFSQKAFDGNPVSFFLKLNPDEWHFRELVITLKTLAKKIASPLLSRYWSTTPYRLGDEHVVKYSARPCTGESADRPADAGDDYLADVLAASLADGDACFEFLVQPQKDPEAQPIEDPSIEWDDARTPFLKAATIRIPAQTFQGPDRAAFCENLSFNPWHSLPAHAPIGGINRVRRVVYDAISDLRHGLNGVERAEPVDHTIPAQD